MTSLEETMRTAEDIDAVMALIRAELVRATTKFAAFNSPHEGYAVILEEVDELWDEVKANNARRAIEEAIQAAAMGARFVLDMLKPGGPQVWLDNRPADGGQDR